MSRLVSHWDHTSDSCSDPGAGSDVILVKSATCEQEITMHQHNMMLEVMMHTSTMDSQMSSILSSDLETPVDRMGWIKVKRKYLGTQICNQDTFKST